MTTFCRITGKSRGLPKPNYFPLLPPISPADAKRFCRITGKAYGLPSHHYIPVLVSKARNKKKHSEKPHVLIAGYRYVFPCLKDAPTLIQLLEEKEEISDGRYVYAVKERKYGLVFSAKLEKAVRDGDVRDVMLAKDADTVLLKMKKGGDISVEVRALDLQEIGDLFEGQGITTVVKKKKPTCTDSIRKIFEDKEIASEQEAIEAERPRKKAAKGVRSWKNVEPTHIDNVEKPSFDKWEWKNFEANGIEGQTISTPAPISLKPTCVDLSVSTPGIIQQPYISDEYTNLQTAQIVAPFKPLKLEVDSTLVQNVMNMSADKLEKTTICEISHDDLPQLQDVRELVELIDQGTVVEKNGTQGIEVKRENSFKFIVGQTVETSKGSQFIPGQTMQSPSGEMFVPGIVTITENGPKLLPGLVIPVDGKNEFIAGQITLTSSGEKFVAGQHIQTSEGVKFQPGQTVLTEDGIKFIPGQILDDRFIPGQTVTTESGPQFIAGQTIESVNGTTLIPGQSMWSEDGWQFVHGVTMTVDSCSKFVPGRYVTDPESKELTFIPGQYVNENNREEFVPGVTVNDNGLKFINGMSISTPEGHKFVQGRVVSGPTGNRFVPGTSQTLDGETIFSPAKETNELAYIDSEISFQPISPAITNILPKGLYSEGVYGHMVQSSHGVEFFPGPATSLPAGKVVPGKLIRGEEMKFVPGLMIEDSFIPGQVVMTDRGEQFIPGQVIETAEGPKFVPGQIIHTSEGAKFVPGQAVETEEGPKFVPGQIVETKAGPTFIPGQVIFTDEGGSKFVPGQVVETIEGPRFVPGRVIETGDHVTFIPGQVVETSEGLRFVAQDLSGENGNSEFTVQGFEISPEELKLLQPMLTGANAVDAREMTIDSRMLRQLSEAGMAIGRQVNVDIPQVNVKSAPAMSTACSLAQKFKLDPVTTVKLSEIIAAVVQIGKLGEIIGTSEEIKVLNGILERVVHCKNNEEAYKLISNIIEKEFNSNMLNGVDKLHSYITSSESPLRKLNKVNVMKEVLNCHVKTDDLLDKFAIVMNEEDDNVSVALQYFSEVQPEILDSIVQRFSDTVGKLEGEKEVVETLHRAIVATVRESSEQSIVDLLKNTENLDLKTLILEAVGLAKALDMHDTAVTLLGILSNPKCTNILAGDRVTLEILRRLTVMRKLAERRPELLAALKNLHTDPYRARTDPALRQLVKESAALLVIPEEGVTSKTIPTSLFFSQNSLAMEEFLYKTKRVFSILVIIKNGIQAIIPREASHSVLTGSVPYVVLDEKGLHYFQPKHVFSALRLPKIATHWFSLYKCELKDVLTN
ncbi:uncharacterized protein LOC106671546 [Cimex lectularius]|uniref:Uncharacterized protein n=1 Tax=Cimex lectularius TaxID=79782 RepID=A0A8I6TGY0_CIMLE|nr:uncharacterized protein LOC106671546 [Cimex lectularius]